MSVFEFVLVPLAIIIGFAISEILGSWGAQVRNRHQRRPEPVQIASSAFILFFCMVYLWALWLARDVAWTFPLYFLVALPGLSAALAAHISRVDTSSDAAPALEQYFQNSRPIYALLTVFPIAITTISLVPGVRDRLPDPPNLVAVTLMRLVLLALIVSLAWSKSPKYHLAAIGTLWVLILGAAVRVVFLA